MIEMTETDQLDVELLQSDYPVTPHTIATIGGWIPSSPFGSTPTERRKES